jgi:alpha-N-arabinofuranosidase
VELSVDADRDWYNFAFARPGGEATELGGGEVRYLSVEAGGMFTGVYLAMYAQGEGRPCSAPADFDWFDYTYRE